MALFVPYYILPMSKVTLKKNAWRTKCAKHKYKCV